jgi:hypothetical protein
MVISHAAEHKNKELQMSNFHYDEYIQRTSQFKYTYIGSYRPYIPYRQHKILSWRLKYYFRNMRGRRGRA